MIAVSVFRARRVTAVVGAAIFSASPAAGARAAAPTPAELDTRLLVQEGLAIALASTVLQTQLDVLFAAGGAGTVGKCVAQSDGSSLKIVSRKSVSTATTDVGLTFYFDKACAKTFATSVMTSVSSGGTNATLHLTGKVTYHDVAGTKVGSMAIDERAYAIGTLKNGYLNAVAGLGLFTPANGASRVSLGLTCTGIDAALNKHKPLPCEGGVAQNFPKLGLALGLVAPLTVDLSLSGPITFSGVNGVLGTAGLGKLSIGLATPTTLGLKGNYTHFGSTAAKGEAGAFSLFPPQPTDWTVTDMRNNQKFSISVVSATKRNSVGSVIDTKTGKTLATIDVDKSGTGVVRYSVGGSAVISSWTVGD